MAAWDKNLHVDTVYTVTMGLRHPWVVIANSGVLATLAGHHSPTISINPVAALYSVSSCNDFTVTNQNSVLSTTTL